ncbi:MAG: glycosyltransferase family 2 protein [Candidatus Dormibacteria bacterium]
MPRPRVLLAITAYNGAAFVPRCVDSGLRLSQARVECDVLVLDDASPEKGFSEMLRGICESGGAQYYRSPRNLGIPRNVNLALLRGLTAGYDHVVVSNSDVVYPANMIEAMVAVTEADETIGSVMAWSNNASVYSLLNESPDEHLAGQEMVDWVSACLQSEFGPAAQDIPSGISFCLLVPTRVLRKVGLMDPVFGRGYCEEIDWTLRSQSLGFRTTVAPGVFVYHMGGGTNVGAGLVPAGHTTVPAHEKILDLRFPGFRGEVDVFLHSQTMARLNARAAHALVMAAASRWGWRLQETPGNADGAVSCVTIPRRVNPVVSVGWSGFSIDVPTDGMDPGLRLRAMFGGEPAPAEGVRPQLAGTATRQPLYEGAVYPPLV